MTSSLLCAHPGTERGEGGDRLKEETGESEKTGEEPDRRLSRSIQIAQVSVLILRQNGGKNGGKSVII